MVHRRAPAVCAAGRLAPFAGQEAHNAPLTIKETALNIVPHIGPVAALLAGILILVMPRLLNYIVAIYLIIIGVLGLVGR
jgi:hypothetical protein